MLGTEIKVFLSYLESVKQYSPHTLKGYQRDLEKLSQYLSINDRQDWKNVNEHDIRTFINDERRRGISPRSIQRLLSSCRTFMNIYLPKEKLS